MTYKIGICDDEILQVKVNGLYLQDIASRNNLSLDIKGFTSCEQLFQYLNTYELHILFLDIDMGKKSGIQAAVELFKQKPGLIIIFVTGHREFAGDAYDVEALGYIVKPVDVQKLERLFKKAILQISGSAIPQLEPYLVFTQEKLKTKVLQKDIRSIYRAHTKTVIQTLTKEYETYDSITSLHAKLSTNFIRINQSEIVNIYDVSSIKGNTVYLNYGEEKSISRSYRKNVINAYFNV